jgi:CrcB protein
MFQKLFWLALAGALGTLTRYSLAGAVQRFSGDEFPWGTLAVNLAGCFLAGMFWSIAESRLSISSQIRVVILLGFMGAFTTFSAYALETGQLLRDAQWAWAFGNVAVQNVCGILLFLVGLRIGRFL